MARIIRTTPNTRRVLSLRVVFSFLLFMQIQIPNAHDMKTGKIVDLSFQLASKAAPHMSLNKPETGNTAQNKLQKVN